jgi:serine/threonine protein phosphatase 1
LENYLLDVGVIWKPRKKNDRAAAVPDGLRIYAIGDIHGRADLLSDLFSQIDDDRGNFPKDRAVHVFLGDYVDRGPDSREVIDMLIRRGREYPSAFLWGNHETFLLDFLNDPTVFAEWRQFGGLQTVMSYGLTPSLSPDEQERVALSSSLNRLFPDIHRRFLGSMKLSFTCGDFYFVHAGVRPGIALEHQREEDLLWIREDFLFHEGAFDKFIVHGHTPVKEPDIRFNRINIDTGAYASGKLTCLVLERQEKRFLSAVR